MESVVAAFPRFLCVSGQEMSMRRFELGYFDENHIRHLGGIVMPKYFTSGASPVYRNITVYAEYVCRYNPGIPNGKTDTRDGRGLRVRIPEFAFFSDPFVTPVVGNVRPSVEQKAF